MSYLINVTGASFIKKNNADYTIIQWDYVFVLDFVKTADFIEDLNFFNEDFIKKTINVFIVAGLHEIAFLLPWDFSKELGSSLMRTAGEAVRAVGPGLPLKAGLNALDGMDCHHPCK